jgi:hypothetical protein
MATLFWNIFDNLSVSGAGETIQKVSDTTSISPDGTTYAKRGSTTVGSDGSVVAQMGTFSTEGSTRIGSTAAGLGALFNDRGKDMFGFYSHDDDKWSAVLVPKYPHVV